MDRKNYDLGVIVGRFQILHRGHSQIISEALEQCEELAIFIGSSQEQGSYKNPFSYEKRREFILKAFPGVKVYPLPDIGVGNCTAWGDYVLANVREKCGREPDVFVTGAEERRLSWFDESVAVITLPKTVEISATAMKEFLIDGDRARFEEYIDPALKSEYEYMRTRVIESRDKLQSSSM